MYFHDAAEQVVSLYMVREGDREEVYFEVLCCERYDRGFGMYTYALFSKSIECNKCNTIFLLINILASTLKLGAYSTLLIWIMVNMKRFPN